MQRKTITWLVGGFVLLGLAMGGWFLSNRGDDNFTNPKKVPHFEGSTPSHGATLAAVPINVVIDVNFDLATGSSITILRDGQDVGSGETTIDTNRLAMRRPMLPQAPDGRYTVRYSACWPDQSCHDGSFQFAIDRTQAATFIDHRGETNVEIDMRALAFAPLSVRVSSGTTVTWKNSDSVSHYVNTDNHPAHTYFPSQNSFELKSGENYAVTLTKAGIYPYHCSAHAGTMVGTLLVD